VRPTLPPGQELLVFDEIDSTNEEAQRLVAEGRGGPLWIWARSQRKGRGRQGRHWVSEPGNLYATHLFEVAAPPAVAAQIGFVAALAIRDLALNFLGQSFSSRIVLKWPNDVLLDGAKFAGILSETSSSTPSRNLAIVLGCGINLAHAPEGTAYSVTALANYGVTADPEIALGVLADRLQHWLDIWRAGAGFDRIRTAWLSHAMGLGAKVIGDNGLDGVFTGVADNGAMIVTLASGETRILHSGEVRFASLLTAAL